MAVLAIPTPATVNGLPFHPLVVHVVVVLIPLSVVGAIGISVWPAMRRHLGLLTLGFSVIALIAVPFATSSGEKFRDKLGAAQLVRQHQHYAEHLLPWTAGLVVAVLLTMIVDLARRLGPVTAASGAVGPPAEQLPSTGGGGVGLATRPDVDTVVTRTTRLDRALAPLTPAALRNNLALLRLATPILGVITIAVSVVLAYYCYKTGDSGAKAVWDGR
jgi:hypothetical protein